jgi:hypothetical protein
MCSKHNLSPFPLIHELNSPDDSSVVVRIILREVSFSVPLGYVRMI